MIFFTAVYTTQQQAQIVETDSSTVKYFKTFVGYSIPLKLSVQISKNEAEKSGHSYYICFYGKDGSIGRIEKKIGDRLIFKQIYEYHPNGVIKKLLSISEDGKVTTRIYSTRGSPLDSGE